MELNKRVLIRNSYSFDKAMKRLKNLNDDNDIELKKIKVSCSIGIDGVYVSNSDDTENNNEEGGQKSGQKGGQKDTGYGIDKMLIWEKLTKGKVEFTSDLVCSTITYWFGEQASGQAGGQPSDQASDQVSDQVGVQARIQARVQVQRLVNVIREDAYTVSDLLRLLHLKGRRNFVENYLKPAIEEGYVLRAYPDKPNHPNQRYYLSEKGLKLVK